MFQGPKQDAFLHSKPRTACRWQADSSSWMSSSPEPLFQWTDRGTTAHDGFALAPLFGIDHQFNAAITLFSLRSGVGHHGMILPVADHEKLLWTQPHATGEHVIDGHRPGDRERMVILPLAARHRIAVGVPLDADDLVGIVAAHSVATSAMRLAAPGRSRARPIRTSGCRAVPRG